MDTSRRSVIQVAGAAFLTFAVSACAGPGNGGQTAKNTVASGAGAGSGGGGDLGTLRIVTSSQSLNFIGITDDFGQWGGTGLGVDVIAGDSKTNAAAIASGSADVSLQAGNTGALAIAKGLDASIVGAVLLPWNQLLIVGDRVTASRPEDLRGGTFGITSFGSGGDYATQRMAGHLGWGKGDYKEVTIGGGPSGLAAALKQGKIDAFYWNAGVAYQLEADKVGKVLGKATDYVGPTVFQPIIVRNDVIKQHPERVVALVKGFQKAVEVMKSDPSKAVEILVTKWGQKQGPSQRAVEDLIPDLNADVTIPDENLIGLGDAVSFTTEGKVKLSADALKKMYAPWTDLEK